MRLVAPIFFGAENTGNTENAKNTENMKIQKVI